jgi:hypothetical protein
VAPSIIIAHYLTRIPKKRRGRKGNRKNNNRPATHSTNKKSLDIREHLGNEKSGSVEDDEYSQMGYT